MFAVILNYGSGEIDVIDISDKPEGIDAEPFIENEKNYNLRNCYFMAVPNYPVLNFIPDGKV